MTMQNLRAIHEYLYYLYVNMRRNTIGGRFSDARNSTDVHLAYLFNVIAPPTL